MSKLKEILDGFKNLIWENPRIEKIALDRAIICGDCIYNVQNKCSQCGCFLQAKIRSEFSKCPMLKWPQ